MAEINWDSTNKRFYEGGLDRVVLYPNEEPGVPWFGVVNINEQSAGGLNQSYYIDGVKYLMVSGYEEFKGSITAINYPSEFAEAMGNKHIAMGLTATQQRRGSFGLSYRTLIGSDTKDLGFAYKLHFVYNAMVGPTNLNHSSLRDTPALQTYQWNLDTKPVPFPGLKPLSHLVVDSREVDPEIMQYLESFIYGSSEMDPYLLNPGELASILSGYEIEIED